MPHPKDLGNYDLITADFSYIRWLGNRKDIEKLTTTWNSTIIDRTAELQTWVDVCEKIQKRGITQYVYANNHYSGFAPATVELFRSLCKARGIETPLNIQLPVETEPTHSIFRRTEALPTAMSHFGAQVLAVSAASLTRL